MGKKSFLFIAPVIAWGLGWMVFAGLSQERIQSRAYAGHENDRDIQNFIRQYPKAAGTRLDDCQTCHRSGVTGTDTEREYSPCGYCHLLQYPNPRYKTGFPKNYEETLNAYGLAYKRAGRTPEALAALPGWIPMGMVTPTPRKLRICDSPATLQVVRVNLWPPLSSSVGVISDIFPVRDSLCL